MSKQKTRIEQDILAEPHIEGWRVPVLTVVERVEGRGRDPRTVADSQDLELSEVYAALLYYHDNQEEFEELRRELEVIVAEVEAEIERPDNVDPSDVDARFGVSNTP